MTIQSTLGCRLEQARRDIGFSQSQLARRIAVKQKTLENWESDRSDPRADKLLKLAGVLQVPLIWLLTGETPQGSIRPATDPDTAGISHKIDRAITLQQDLAALLIEVSADVRRLQRDIDEDREIAA